MGEKVQLPKKFSCNQCSFKTSRKQTLGIHVKSLHEGVRFNCDLCEFEARGSAHLYRHVK